MQRSAHRYYLHNGIFCIHTRKVVLRITRVFFFHLKALRYTIQTSWQLIIREYRIDKQYFDVFYSSAHLIAQYRPRAVIMTVTRSLKTARQVHLYRGCCPVHVSSKFSLLETSLVTDFIFSFLAQRSKLFSRNNKLFHF